MTDLPYGVARPPGGEPRCVTRVEDRAIDLSALDLPVPPETFSAPSLNPFLALGSSAWAEVAGRLAELADPSLPGWPLGEVELLLPIEVGDYVDFYSSRFHAENVSRLFRPDAEPLLPNWRALPVGYHGRAGTVVVSGTDVRRPAGILGPEAVGPEPMLDYELELAFVTGADAIFGFALMNDWSARAIQGFEYQPLGPFLGKSFATSLAAWITPAAALERYRVDGEPQEPEPAPHLRDAGARVLDLELEAIRNGEVICATNARHLYWSPEQQLAHAISNGATIRPGDLFGSGTISGPDPDSRACLLETQGPVLADGDELVLRGRTPDGAITLGDVRGRVVS
ncbi:MAG TPA: fumarylacetoacetate hydrolase family protein [Solirubrobacteraceae bacterium]|nr:fumarylacetoacetate hydrolase family protein [Solirubrobacteraceae bacterium]